MGSLELRRWSVEVGGDGVDSTDSTGVEQSNASIEREDLEFDATRFLA